MDSEIGWLSIREAAKLASCTSRAMKRRLLRLHRDYPGLLRRFGDAERGKWWVNTAELKRVLRPDVEIEERVADIEYRTAVNEAKIDGLRDLVVEELRKLRRGSHEDAAFFARAAQLTEEQIEYLENGDKEKGIEK